MSTTDQVNWFRNSSPYINAHRGRTFVVMMTGEVLDSPLLPSLVHDLALLNTLGVRLVLVHGARPQISRRLHAAGLETHFEHHTRITDSAALEAVIAAVGALRLKLEGLFSMGLANTPMHNASIQLISGNFVIAKPKGVRDGFDYQHTGEVRRIEVGPIRRQVDAGNVVLLSPLGSSPTGELFNLNAEEVASTAAIALAADKLIVLGDGVRIDDEHQRILRELTPQEAGRLLADQRLQDSALERHLTAACHAASNGVARAHLLDAGDDGVLLKELFTRDGCGTMVTRETYETLRGARIEDVGGVLELISPLEADGTLVRRSRELLESEIQRFLIIERDGMVIACAALYPFPDEKVGELACVAVHPQYRSGERGIQLLRQLERRAREQGLERLFVLTTHTAHWFQEQGFQPADVHSLPAQRQQLYNWQRNSKVFVKTL
ncbi:amino-acid N-acetyltransferase [Alloalcanivorax xenomutans]|uniref:Amino-acid acetyltransferase n=1 Tax=Alloalcanivorax xenomutans TaxID=1094342 RepID=A0A9Q3W583_9GAMM|nr:amino-acid N-acetyltransferase [Alloalcanivorax xenomutans]ERS10160.1 N-acetylglutamate synthase [Alcanivorax sp. PN-3]KYZ84505.1 amino-acid N-acetyltransferase [Alcanivorax sp. KX64203]MBA4720038.1 amino-acid N-acetyltransferase [Alcanivorax sp.]ARB44507.1 N-acetylglutamate synthase [Alloalcanivorax xenomutans]MCE7509418.1 amino-acid N-acetyltransferase [Alloalcanivorax xenomutans]